MRAMSFFTKTDVTEIPLSKLAVYNPKPWICVPEENAKFVFLSMLSKWQQTEVAILK